jgi:hypothetical protein
VNGLDDLTITTTELIDSPVSDKDLTKHEKQDRFKAQHRLNTLLPKIEDFQDCLNEKIYDLRQLLNKEEIHFASLEDNPRIIAEKYN